MHSSDFTQDNSRYIESLFSDNFINMYASKSFVFCVYVLEENI